MSEPSVDKQNLLTMRARRLAERSSTDVATAPRESILIFRLGGERFAIRLKFVAAVLPFDRVTRVPTAGDRVLGVMAIRGEIHAVYALDRVLELPRAAAGDSGEGHVLALRGLGRQLGVRVDRVEAIDHIESGPAADQPALARAFVKPVASAALILIEDLEKLFNSLSRGEDQ